MTVVTHCRLKKQVCNKLNKLVAWRDSQIADGVELFMGLPDLWYDDLTWGCENGHISSRYLKSERYGGDVCLCCYKPVILVAPLTTEEELKKVLSI